MKTILEFAAGIALVTVMSFYLLVSNLFALLLLPLISLTDYIKKHTSAGEIRKSINQMAGV